MRIATTHFAFTQNANILFTYIKESERTQDKMADNSERHVQNMVNRGFYSPMLPNGSGKCFIIGKRGNIIAVSLTEGLIFGPAVKRGLLLFLIS